MPLRLRYAPLRARARSTHALLRYGQVPATSRLARSGQTGIARGVMVAAAPANAVRRPARASALPLPRDQGVQPANNRSTSTTHSTRMAMWRFIDMSLPSIPCSCWRFEASERRGMHGRSQERRDRQVLRTRFESLVRKNIRGLSEIFRSQPSIANS